jgi:uncharacterized protein (DUF305 family)
MNNHPFVTMMKHHAIATVLVVLIIALTIGWIATQNRGMDHDMSQMNMGGMDMSTPKGDQGPASMAFAKANAAMHTGMNIEYSGNADVDFAKGMIPHHQGAVEMAKIVLQYGKDAELRKLAEGIVAAQESEIKFMNDWLAKNAK